MKKINLLLYVLAFCICTGLSAQSKSQPPTKYPDAARWLDRKVWDLFDSTHANGFVMMGFEVTERNTIENLSFSKNFPEKIKAHIIETFKPDAERIQSVPSKKKILWPILYQYHPSSFTIEVDAVLEAFSFEKFYSERKGIIDVVVMPVCRTGFTVR